MSSEAKTWLMRQFLGHLPEPCDGGTTIGSWEFAKKLQENGLRVWFDEWELLPGDSLVDKDPLGRV